MDIFCCWLFETNLQLAWILKVLRKIVVIFVSFDNCCMNIRIESCNILVASTTHGERNTWYSVNGYCVFHTYCISFSCFDKSKIIDLLNIGVRASCHRLNTIETAQRYRCKFVLSCQLQHLNMFVQCTELDWVGWISYCYVWFLYHLSGFDHLEGWICYVHNFSLNCDLKRNYFMQEITYKLLYNHELVCWTRRVVCVVRWYILLKNYWAYLYQIWYVAFVGEGDPAL